MDSSIIEENGLRSKRVGQRAATVAGVLLIIALLIPIFFYQDPPPGQPGILVNLGLPDQGQGEENAQASTAQPSAPAPTPPTPEPPAPSQPAAAEETPAVVQQEDPSVVALRERKEREARERAEAERREQAERAAAERREREEQERREREAREAKERAEAERRAREAAANNTRDQIGGLFGSGSGRGETGTPGNQGDPNGDPNADRVNGISTGNGNVTGLGGRDIVSAPPVTGRTQDAGTVVVRICVNSSGKVVSAKYTVSGSRGATPTLIKLAEANAKKYKFSAGELDSQCGKITYVFKVQ